MTSSIVRTSYLMRLIGAAALDASTYEEVEAEPHAIVHRIARPARAGPRAARQRL